MSILFAIIFWLSLLIGFAAGWIASRTVPIVVRCETCPENSAAPAVIPAPAVEEKKSKTEDEVDKPRVYQPEKTKL